MPSKPRRRPVATDKRFRKASPGGDHGPQERWQHTGRVLEFTERAGVLAARATEEHVLDHLVLRGVLTDLQRRAGLELKLDFHRADLAVHVTSSYRPSVGHAEGAPGIHERNNLEEAAYKRWRNALRQLGPKLAPAVVDTVCYDHWPKAEAALRLKAGLDLLVRYYRLENI